MSDTPRTDAAVVSPAFIAREMDQYRHKFVLADVSRELERENNDLRAKLAAAEKDAARYRWLRDSPNAYPLFFIAQRDPNNIVVQFNGDLADMNIDTVMKEQA